MKRAELMGTSRREFLELIGLSAGAALLARQPLVADEKGIVPTMVHAAARAKITVHPVRRTSSVEVSGSSLDPMAALRNW